MKTKILYASQDDHALYQEVDEPDRFTQIEVDEEITLKASDLCGHYGDILEILLGAGKARIVRRAIDA